MALGLDLRQASLGPEEGLYVGDPHNVPSGQNLDRMSSMQQQVQSSFDCLEQNNDKYLIF